MRLYLFDFDGTISNSDSMFAFLKTIYSLPIYYLLLIKAIPIFIKYKCKIINKHEFKESFLLIFLSRFDKPILEKYANKFAENYNKNLKKSALKFINNLKKDKRNEITIVSASLDIWIKPIAKKIGINYISTESNFADTLFSGIKGENCWGKNKVLRIKNVYRIQDFEDIYAYGDSRGDIEMLKFANHSEYKFFN